jgi:hypothetical protein
MNLKLNTKQRLWAGFLGFLALLSLSVASADPSTGSGGGPKPTGVLPVLQAILEA